MAREILITGCSTGIGRDCAIELRRLGYRVFATARQDKDVAELQSMGLDACQLDVTDSASIDRALAWVLEQTGGSLYALFNNGAYGQPGAVEDLTRDVLREQFETNLFGWHELTCKVLPVMRKQGYGRIIQNSSVLGLVALKYRGAYNASKFALEGLTDTLRLELADTDIHISLVEPGPVTSRFRANAFAAFKRNIDIHNSAHSEHYKAVMARLESEDDAVAPFTLGPEAVTAKVRHALESKRPRARYYVTTATYLLGYLKRLLPTCLLDKVLIASSKG